MFFRLRSYLCESEETVFSINYVERYCKICESKVTTKKKFTSKQHVSRDKH